MWIPIVVIIILISSWIGMWISNSDKMNDQELYGMDAEDYLRKQVGDDYYNRHYNHCQHRSYSGVGENMKCNNCPYEWKRSYNWR